MILPTDNDERDDDDCVHDPEPPLHGPERRECTGEPQPALAT